MLLKLCNGVTSAGTEGVRCHWRRNSCGGSAAALMFWQLPNIGKSSRTANYPSTANVWQTLNIGKAPGIPNKSDRFWSCTWSNAKTLFRSGLPNITGGTVSDRLVKRQDVEWEQFAGLYRCYGSLCSEGPHRRHRVGVYRRGRGGRRRERARRRVVEHGLQPRAQPVREPHVLGGDADLDAGDARGGRNVARAGDGGHHGDQRRLAQRKPGDFEGRQHRKRVGFRVEAEAGVRRAQLPAPVFLSRFGPDFRTIGLHNDI